jgi:hypothetical protein
MKTSRIYDDTSVLGGCFDPEFSAWSIGLVTDFRSGRFIPVLSDLLALEVGRAPERVQEVYSELAALPAEQIGISDAALDLLSAYEARSVLGPKYRADMLHIALASVADVDVLVSWNFKHIVHFDKIRRFNAVSLELGYTTIEIYSPREVTSYGREEI